jgi:glycosyltransferase involved in cell wall biosynthesis
LPPSVITIHDLGFRHFPEAHTPRQRWYLEAGTRWSAHAATSIICVSEATARDLQHAYGTPTEKIHVIHEAAASRPQTLGKENVAAVRAALGLRRPFALFLGTIQPRKNLQRLMEAYAALASQHDLQWDLVLAGNLGWLSESLLALPNALGLADRIHFTGYISEDERVALLQAADFFCFPSLYEGFGLPVLEAQQMGVPVMTSNNSSLPEVAGDAALLVDPNDIEAMAAAMLRLSQDESLRQELIAAGFENVRRFSWDKAAAETLAVLEAAAAQGNQ